MSEEKARFEMTGMIKGVEIKENDTGKGTWKKKASLTIESNGTKYYVATFDEGLIDIANSLNGKNVRVTYVENGKYKNLVSGGLVDANATPDTGNMQVTEETVKAAPTPVAPKPVSTVTPKLMPTASTYSNSKDDYWKEKLVFDIERAKDDRKKQTLIIRQNAWSQALKYTETLVKSVELGILDKSDGENGFNKDDLNLSSLIELAHKIEEDISRVN